LATSVKLDDHVYRVVSYMLLAS